MQKVERMTEAPKPTGNNGQNSHNGRLVTQSVS